MDFTKSQAKLLRTAVNSRINELERQLEDIDRMTFHDDGDHTISENISNEIKELKQIKDKLIERIDLSLWNLKKKLDSQKTSV